MRASAWRAFVAGVSGLYVAVVTLVTGSGLRGAALWFGIGFAVMRGVQLLMDELTRPRPFRFGRWRHALDPVVLDKAGREVWP